MREFATDILIGGLWVLTLARLTRLLTRDEITDFIRVWAFGRFGEDSWVARFVQCPWCVGMWLSFGTLWPVFLGGGWDWRMYPLLALSGSYLVGLFAVNLEEEEDVDIEIHDS